MEADITGKYHNLFSRLIGCEGTEDTESTPVGVTRTGELADFVDLLMDDWTEQLDRGLAPLFISLPVDKQQAFLQQRFCTYGEFKQLHAAPKHGQPHDTIVFKLLGVTHAHQQETYKKRFPPDREGYFKLMEILQPHLRTFFFPAVRCVYPCC